MRTNFPQENGDSAAAPEDSPNSSEKVCEKAEVERIPNGLRHAFCTHRLALNANENLTAQQAGNSPAMVHSNRRDHDMALTRGYKETVLARIKSDRKFARPFYAGAIEMLLEGETAEALSRLRDLVHAEITFKELARQTGLGEKTLHQMLNRRGNPTARNLGVIVGSIGEDLG